MTRRGANEPRPSSSAQAAYMGAAERATLCRAKIQHTRLKAHELTLQAHRTCAENCWHCWSDATCLNSSTPLRHLKPPNCKLAAPRTIRAEGNIVMSSVKHHDRYDRLLTRKASSFLVRAAHTRARRRASLPPQHDPVKRARVHRTTLAYALRNECYPIQPMPEASARAIRAACLAI